MGLTEGSPWQPACKSKWLHCTSVICEQKKQFFYDSEGRRRGSERVDGDMEPGGSLGGGRGPSGLGS